MGLCLPETCDVMSSFFIKKNVYFVFHLSKGYSELIIRISMEETVQHNDFINSPGNSIQSPRRAQRMRAGMLKVGLQGLSTYIT